ncbi:MAG: abscisic acid-deficient protein Aba4 family protein [Thiohalocapsa sp.]
MAVDSIFAIANIVAVIVWLALFGVLLLGPSRWRRLHRTVDLAASIIVPCLYALVYIVLMATSWGEVEGGFGSLAELLPLYASPGLVVAGWLHYLAIDMFVGAWQLRETARHGLPRLLVLPCMVLTFLLGPVGLLLFLILRTVFCRRVALGQVA